MPTVLNVPSLRDFIAQRRDAIRDLCVEKIRSEWPDRPGSHLEEDLGAVIDEIVRALSYAQGRGEASPPPGKSAAAALHGRHRERLGYTIEILSRDFGAISDSLGELGGREGLAFDAREYQTFNLCLDSAIGTAIEQYWTDARARLEQATTERVGALAHELRNALASARMAFSLLKRGKAGVESRTGDVLGRGLARLDALIGQTLLAVHLDAGLGIEPRRIRATTLLHDVVDSAVPERGVTISVEVDDGLDLDADERLLTSALTNLVQNAIKFTRSGGCITVRARGTADLTTIEVEDQCGGLPAGRQEELFTPSVQRGDDRRGLGLGLSVTRRAISAHGGQLSVDNIPGKGCVFVVTLGGPAQRAQEAVEARP